MGHNKKKKKDKKSAGGWLYSIFNTQTSSTPYCTPDQCFITNQQAFSSTSLISPLNPEHAASPFEFNTSTLINDLSVDGYQYPIKDGAGIIQSKIHNHSF